jgi:hypothetical protein
VRNGTVQRFDPADGLGDIALDDGATVRFGLGDCVEFRSIVPAAGLRVIVEDIRPGFRGALRATKVRPLGESWDAVRPVWGLTEPRTIDDRFDGRVRCVPFDPSAFDRIGEARVHDADALAFTPRRFEERVVHPAAEPLRGALAREGRLAFAFARGDGEPAIGSTFVGDAFADLDGEWPRLHHLLQIGRSDAQRLGIDKQLNVFSKGSAPPVIIASSGGARHHAAKSKLPVVALHDPREITVYPASSLLTSDDEEVKQQLTSFDRVYVLSPDGVLHPPDLRWFASGGLVARSWPMAEQLPDALVLGGVAVPMPGRPTYRRLASLSLDLCAGLRGLLALEKRLNWQRLSIDWRPDAEPAAIAYSN